MIARREKDLILFSFSSLERKVLERALAVLIESYKVRPEEVDAKATAVWYSSRGCKIARMSTDETSEWLKHLHTLRVGRIEVLENCRKQLSERSQPPWMLQVPVQKAEALMTALNDYRLLIAARHDIGETEMSLRTLASWSKLPPEQQTALWQIEFLAYVVDELLHLLQEAS